MEKIIKKTNLGVLLLSFFGFCSNIAAQCPASPTTCDFTVTSASNQTASFSVGAGKTLCITSGTYTGYISSVNATGKIYVASGAVFNPSGIGGFGGALINCGSATLPSFDFNDNNNLTRVENYGVMTLTGSYNFNAASTWINGLSSKMTFNNGMTMIRVNMTNNGNMLFKSSFTINGSANNFVNHDSLTANGNIILEGSIDNDGYVFAKGSNLTLNAAGNITNKCYFKSDGSFTYNGSDTLFITGLTWVTGKNSGGFNIQGTAVNVSSSGWIQGVDFLNNKYVIGSGNLLFTGNTTNQGSFGSDAKGLNFFDSSIPTGGKFFDTQNNNPNASVTKNPLTARDSTYVPGTCSALIRCDIGGTGGAGNDTTVCGSSIDLKDAQTPSPFLEAWTAVAGNPAAASINSTTGLVTGMTVAGDYYFRLYKTTNTNCNDVIKVTVVTTPVSTLNVAGSTVCRTSPNATVQILNAENGVRYNAFLGSSSTLGFANGTGTNLTINIPTATLVDGANIIRFTAERPTCGTIPLINQATINVSPNQNTGAAVSATSPICNGQKSTITLAATKGVNYKVYDQNSVKVADTTAAATGNISFTTTVLTATTAPVIYTLTINAEASPCTQVPLLTKPIVVVNPSQNAGAQVLTSSPICSGGKSTVSITPTKGIKYSVYDQNGKLLGDSVAQSSATLNIVTSPLTATSGPQTYTLKISAKVAGCDSVILTARPTILVNPYQSAAATVSATSPVCSGSTSAISIAATRGVKYTVKDQDGNVLAVSTAASTGTLTFNTSVLSATTSPDTLSLFVSATISSCDTVNLVSHPKIIVNPAQNLNASVTAVSPICSGNGTIVTVFATKGITYSVKDQSGAPLGSKTATATGSMTINTSVLSASSQPTTYSLTLTASVAGCTPKDLLTTPSVVVNPIQSVGATVTAVSPICSGSTTTVSIAATKGITYTVYNPSNISIGSATATVSGNLSITTSALTASANGTSYTLKVIATVGGCTPVELTTKPVVVVNKKASQITVSDATVCSNTTSTSLTLTGVETNVSYQAYFGKTPIGSPVVGPATLITFNPSSLPVGNNKIGISGSISGCTPSTMTDTALVKINKLPVDTAFSATTPICQGTLTTVNLKTPKTGVTYTITDTYNTSTKNLSPALNASGIGNYGLIGVGLHTLKIKADIAGCTTVNFTSFANVQVNVGIDSVVLTGVPTSPICQKSNSVTIKISNPATNVDYNVYKQVGSVETKVNSSPLTISSPSLTITDISVGSNTYIVKATIGGCGTSNVKSFTVNVDKNVDSLSAKINAGLANVCQGTTDVINVSITGSQNGVTYILKNNGIAIDTVKSTSDNETLPFLGIKLKTGLNIFTATGFNNGCGTINLASKDSVFVNDSLRFKSPILVAGADSVCQGTSDNVTIRLTNAQIGVEYQLYDNNSFMGSPIKAISPNFAFGSFKLGLGNNAFKVAATNSGCSTQFINSTDHVFVSDSLRTKGPVLDAGNLNICQSVSNAVYISLKNTQTGVSYHLLDSTKVISPDFKSTGTDIVFGPFAFSVGRHIISVVAKNAGCTSLALKTKDTIVVSDTISTSGPKLLLDKNNVCQGSSDVVNVKLVSPQKGVSYILKVNGVPKGSTITAIRQNDTLTFRDIKLDIGNNAFAFSAFNNGCTLVKLDTKSSISVSDSLDLRNPVIDGSPFNACEGTDNVEVDLITTQKDASYIIYDNGSAIGDTLKSKKAGDLLEFGKFTFSVGMHYLTSYAYNDGCAAQKLLAKDSVKVSKKIDPNSAKLKSGLDEICETGDAFLTLSKTQIGVTYNIFEKGLKLGSKKSIADSSDLTFGAFKLTPGLHVFTIDAFNDACTDTIFTTDSIKVNDAPVADFLVLTPNKWILCSNDTLKIKVYTVKGLDYKYTLIDNFGGVISQLLSVKSGNLDTLKFSPISGLSPGKHRISVIESVFGCDADTSNFIEITINNALDTRTPQIDASKGVICTDGSISFTVSKTAKGDEYRLYDGSQLLMTRTSTADLETLYYSPLFNLSPGWHTFYGTITNPGCGTFPMEDSTRFLVNAPPDENTKVTSNSPICVNQAVTFIVQKADSVLYSLYSVRPLKLVAGPDSSILKTKVYTIAQKDSFYVAANIAGCATVWLNPMQKITVNEFPTESLVATDFITCGDDSAVVKLLTPTTVNAYIATLGSTTISKNGPGALSYKFATNSLTSDSNSVGFQIFVPGCNYKTITSSTIYKISSHESSSNAAVCENDTMMLSIPKVKGVDSSVWVVPVGVNTISVDNDTATFKWGLKNTEGKIVVYPVGTLGKCNLYSDTINVTVYEKTKGTADYIQIDTLCVGAIDTISLVDLLGVLKDSLIPANGVEILEVISKSTEFNRYVVKYNLAQVYVHEYLIVSPCGTDTIIKTRQVVVLPNPIADAGNYPVYDMLYFPREVVLDGSSSSKGNFKYSWRTIPSGNVSNATNLVASFVPEQPSTIVELSVTNSNGMCSTSDTAVINVSLGIFIPNVFTPNNDGDHDNWLLENVQSFFPNVSVDIYSKWGTHIFHSSGYNKPWDGKKNGEELPSATYYYVIDLKKPNFKPVAGSVTILR